MSTSLREELQHASALTHVVVPLDGIDAARQRGRTLRRRQLAIRVATPVLAGLVGLAAIANLVQDPPTGDSLRTVPPAESQESDGVGVVGGVSSESGGRPFYVERPDHPGKGELDSTLENAPGPAKGAYGQVPPPPPGAIGTRSGTLAFIRDNDIMLIENGVVRNLTNGPDIQRHAPSWSPDGKQIVYHRVRSDQKIGGVIGVGQPVHDLWVIEVATGTERLLYADPESTLERPIWWPDGRISFGRRPADTGISQAELWMIDADGSNPRRTNGPASAVPSPDGRFVAYGCADWLCIANADFTGERQVPNTLVRAENETAWNGVAWSPDSKRLAATSNLLLLVDVDGSNMVKIRNQGGTSPTWSPDGSTVVWQNDSGCLAAVNPDGSGIRCLPGESRDGQPAWSR